MLNNLLDYIPDDVFTVDAEWCVTFFNRAAERITGIKHAEAGGCSRGAGFKADWDLTEAGRRGICCSLGSLM